MAPATNFGLRGRPRCGRPGSISDNGAVPDLVTSGSDELFDRARAVTPGGVNSPVRAFNAVGGTPRFIASAAGGMDIEEVAAHSPEKILRTLEKKHHAYAGLNLTVRSRELLSPSMVRVVRRSANSGWSATSVVPEISFSWRVTRTWSLVDTRSGSMKSAPILAASS